MWKALSLILLASFTSQAAPLSIAETNDHIRIKRGDTLILTYHKAETPAPEGQSDNYRRSGYIHPLCSPSGFKVTGTRPEDHYHHMGLWHAWVQTSHGDDQIDFWNLKKGQGRVAYVSTEALTQNETQVGFEVIQHHIAYKGPEKKATVILEERFSITASYENDSNIVDCAFTQKNITAEPLVLKKFRYGGGLGYRSPKSWMEQGGYLTSTGEKNNAHETRAEWITLHGPAGETEKKASLSILISPENHDFPSRLRLWGKAPTFFNVVPIQETPWEIKPGEEVTQSYRLIVRDDIPALEAMAEAHRKAFAK